MKQKQGIFEGAMRYYKIVLLIVALLVAFGIFSIFVMPKQEFPQITIRQGVVAGVYPGASAQIVEEQLSKPLERYLFTYKEINKKKTYSISKEGICYIMVELNQDVYNKDEVWSKIKHGLARFKSELPGGVLALVAQDDFGDTSALLITLQSKDKTYRELQDYLVDLEDRLRRIESISNLRRFGLQNEQISVYFEKEKLAQYKIDNKILAQALITQGLTTGGAEIENSQYNIPIHFAENFVSEKSIADQILLPDLNGNVVRLRDVARVVREYEEPQSYITNNGMKAILLSMEMRDGYNIVQFGKEVDEALAEFQTTIPQSVQVERIADQPKVVNNSVVSFLRDLGVAIVIVILVMMILFPFRSAVVAGISIPVSIFITIGIMYAFGIELNTITLAALIVVLGMIVDNSIVVIDAYLEYLDKGMSRWHAAIMSAKNYFWSILLATLCICIIFYPLLFTLTGEVLDFVQLFPWTITISLMTSLFIAVLLVPFLEFTIIKKGLHSAEIKTEQEGKKKKFSLLNITQSLYNKALSATFKAPKLTILLGLGTVILAVLIFSNIPMRIFPFADRDQFAVEIYLPQSSPLNKTAEICDSMRNVLMRDSRVKSVTSFVGMASPRFQATYAPNLASKNYGQFIVNLESEKFTIPILDEYTDKYANHFPNAYVRFKQLDYQNVALPVEVRFFGDDLATLRTLSDSLADEIRKEPTAVWVHTNFEETLPAINVTLDPVASKRLGISRMTAETELAIRTKGMVFGSMWEGDYSIPIKVMPELYGEEQNFSSVGNEYISSIIPGITVPLRQIANISATWDAGHIIRRNGVLCMSVLANVKRNCNEGELQKNVEKIIKQKFNNLPKGVYIEYGGAKEKTHEVLPGIISGISIAVVIIFFFLLLNFKKMSLAAAALASLLLCALGAALSLWAFGYSFSVTCILGVVTLMGGIVRNVIIMFQHADDLRINQHMKAKDAALDAGKRRMVPIFLTSATTAVGVVPMIVAGTGLWAPMGAVIFIGTIVTMLLTILVMPSVYWQIYGNK